MSADRVDRVWGPKLLADGVEFRLWAPDSASVDLLIEVAEAWDSRPMVADDDGWWRLRVAEAGAGSRYRYQLADGLQVPDPASRFQPEDVHGPSQVVDPGSYRWQHPGWTGRPWHETVVYELHLGTFTPQGTYLAAIDKLDTLVDLGITAVELLPVAAFPGARNWGYDGVLPFAPDCSYGTPDELRQLVDAAHGRGLMVFLDVVYNHFGPEGNYLGAYAKGFFTDHHHTPWGDAVNFDSGPERRWTRQFFIENALAWLEDYGFDGLRLDAVHAIYDDSAVHVLSELAQRVRAGPGRDRRVHLVLENDDNEARWLGPEGPGYDAQWNDDFHHALHVLLTGEGDSYYGDYRDQPHRHLLRTLTEGFAYQGETSPHRGHPRGEPSAGLPPTAFVAFVQNHDQVGNRAHGERIHELCAETALRAATAILLLSPMPPLLFMGQEWCASSRFPFFCDFGGELAEAVKQGRIREFERFDAFSDPEARRHIPDPTSAATFAAAKLRWEERLDADHRRWWRLHQALLALRRRDLVPLLEGVDAGGVDARLLGDSGLAATWELAAGARYSLHANLGETALTLPAEPAGGVVYATPGALTESQLAPWGVVFTL
ncbi:MAG: malto-oligosyltrehalose trehalohydrolase, partial [Pseudomonadales bacterium]